MKRLVLVLLMVGCSPTLAQRQAADREAQARKIDDRCFAVLADAKTPEAERANCYTWLNGRIANHTADLNAQAAQQQANVAAAAAIGAAIQPPPPPVVVQPAPVVAPAGPVLTTCQDIGGGVTNCTSY